MNHSNRNNARHIIHFRRWSNTSYAIFNSIGKVVLIGTLSKLVSGLLTVKSVSSKKLIELAKILTVEKEKFEEILEENIVDKLLILEESFNINIVSDYSFQLVFSQSKNSITKYQSNIKAFMGLFSFVECAPSSIHIRRYYFRNKLSNYS